MDKKKFIETFKKLCELTLLSKSAYSVNIEKYKNGGTNSKIQDPPIKKIPPN